MAYQRIRATYYRGGTSRALIFRGEDLPPANPPDDLAEWNRIFLAAMGSPDQGGRQLDGMGGGVSSLSKVAVVSPSARPDVDVDYTFAQIGIDKPTVGYRGNCGNIGAAIGPFAVEEGLVQVSGDRADITIYNTNTNKLMRAEFELENHLPVISGDFAIDGVAGTAAPVKLSFLNPSGASTGRMFPTGNLRDGLRLGTGRVVEATLVDVANPLAIVRMSDFIDWSGWSPSSFEDPVRLRLLDDIRVAAAQMMGLVDDEDAARTQMTNLPLIALVHAPLDYEGRGGGRIAGKTIDIATQMISAGLPHKATPITGAMALAAAAKVPGTIAADVARKDDAADIFTVGHPSGLLGVSARCDRTAAGWETSETSVYRTARRLYEGHVLVR